MGAKRTSLECPEWIEGGHWQSARAPFRTRKEGGPRIKSGVTVGWLSGRRRGCRALGGGYGRVQSRGRPWQIGLCARSAQR